MMLYSCPKKTKKNDLHKIVWGSNKDNKDNKEDNKDDSKCGYLKEFLYFFVQSEQ